MRIIYLTDIHGDFERVKNLLSETVAHMYIIAGDLIDIPFYNMETSIRYHELQSYFHGLRMKMDEEDKLLEDFVDDLLDSRTSPTRSRTRAPGTSSTPSGPGGSCSRSTRCS
jgi:hypothetical protein